MKQANFFAFRDRPNIGNYPSFFNVDYLTDSKIEKKFGHKCHELLYIWKDKRVRIVLVTRTDFDTLAAKILQKVIDNSIFVDRERQKSLKIAQNYLEFCSQKLKPEILSKTINKELVDFYKTACKYHKDFSFYNVPLWFILGDTFSDFLIKKLGIYTKNPHGVFAELSKPTTASNLNDYNKTLFKLRKKLNNKQLLSDMVNKFSWIPFDYVGPKTWNAQDFKKQAQQHLEQPPDLSEIHKSQVELATKLKLPKNLIRLFKDFQMTQTMSDEKKEFLTKAQIYWQRVLVPEISKRISIPVELVRFMTPTEISSALLKKMPPKNLQQRPNLSVFKKNQTGVEIIYGNKVEKLYNTFNPEAEHRKEVRGRTASLGYAKGSAKILLSPRQIHKVKDGDILIATMTTPDYVIAMKKAAAIVTDEGGMTSHAAIVSREFGIPCIVGTSIATKIFKDNDIVEVLAREGIARTIDK